ncbi:MAG: PadR family transcriptional regulator [Candidatus Micrarchaeota archaeon]
MEKKTRAAAKKDFMKAMLSHAFSTFVLWAISKEPSHGYEIMKKIRCDQSGHMVEASRLYPLLKELTAKGFIRAENEMHGRRPRKVYHISERGRQALKDAKAFMRQNPLKRRFLREMVG